MTTETTKTTATTYPSDSKLLRFQIGSAKLPKRIVHFSIPSGYTCTRCASACLTLADKHTGKITRGVDAEFNCYSAMNEATYPSVRKARWYNFGLLTGLTSNEMSNLILKSLTPILWDFWADYHIHPLIRIHVGGEFFSQKYFDAWLRVASLIPCIQFYAYTKALDLWENRLARIPENLNLTASFGGKHDSKIHELGLKYNLVVFNTREAEILELPLDKDDWHAHTGKVSFASLLHGVQPKETEAAQALKNLKKEGFKGYGKDSYKRPPPDILSKIYRYDLRRVLPGLRELLE